MKERLMISQDALLAHCCVCVAADAEGRSSARFCPCSHGCCQQGCLWGFLTRRCQSGSVLMTLQASATG